MTSAESLAMWTVYDHPKDAPDVFIARKFLVGRRGAVASDETVQAPSLTELRRQLPRGLIKLARLPDDDPVIVEVWV